MIIRPGKWAGSLLALTGALALVNAGALATTDEYAMEMEGAASSLLLDAAVAGDRLVVVGERGHILYSEDDAATWVQARVPTSQMLTRVYFVNDDMGWAVGHDGNVLLSEDGGVNWQVQRPGLIDQAQINEQRAGRAREAVTELEQQWSNAEGDEKEDLATALDDARWVMDNALEKLDARVYAPPLMSVWFLDEQIGWASGGYGSLLHTTNGGRQWQDWAHELDNSEELHLNGIAGSADGSQLYIVSEWGKVFRSLNHGQTWESVETGYDGSFFGVLINPASGSVFAYGLLGTIYRSTDQGESWEPLQSKARASLYGGHGAADGTLVFVGQGGTAVRSRDDGDSFTVLPQPTRRGLYGVERLPDGRYLVAGEGGGSLLVTDEGAQ
ncbi:photosystem I reaction center subunit IV [Seongchinamella sediminis]|uniref:Photosystem I reaction center subunit IV n=1 Tax=Seongchinamella sediminis TaxID=2283635 RepID=A0A3L7DW54_9GAMM|nr:YCF48-related protein [Seongchinamella sediminis]RLQ21356.1 photosystem I reaction center subunit IV [Seongchinamella sediminis]